MTTVQRLLQHKGHTVWSIPPEASVFEAVQLMADKRVGALMAALEPRHAGRYLAGIRGQARAAAATVRGWRRRGREALDRITS